MGELRNRLEEDHREMNTWLLWHQECLLLQEDDFARFAFDEFSGLLSRHMAFENEVILPFVEKQVTAMHWKPALYRKEHEKIGRLLGTLHQPLQRFFASQGKERRLLLLQLLREEETLQRVLEHHGQREEQDLFLHLPQIPAQAFSAWLHAGQERQLRIGGKREELARLLE